MKTAKIILSVITLIFCALGLLKVLPFDISNPLAITSLGTLLLLRSIEYKNRGDKRGFILILAVVLFGYAAVIYCVFIV